MIIMTELERLEALDKETLTPKDVSAFLGCNPYAINVKAKQCPESIPFPFFMSGSRVIIPKVAFIRWAKGEANTSMEQKEMAIEDCIKALNRLVQILNIDINEKR